MAIILSCEALLILWFDEHPDILWSIILKEIKVTRADGTII